VRARQTNESKCNRPEDSDGLSDTHSGRVSAARGARDEHSTFARDGFLVLKVTQSRSEAHKTRSLTAIAKTCIAPRPIVIGDQKLELKRGNARCGARLGVRVGDIVEGCQRGVHRLTRRS
jgi:hypothetical protein